MTMTRMGLEAPTEYCDDGGEIFEACFSGDIKRVQSLLASGVNPNMEDPDGKRVLLEAIKSNAVEGRACVRALLEAKADQPS